MNATTHRAELELLLAAVDLHDDAVDLEVEIVTVLAPVLDERDDVVERGAERALRIRRQTELLHQRVRIPLRRDLPPVDGDDVVDVRAETLLRDELRILLPERAGGGVARIRERLLPRFLELFIELREVAFGDVDLAADLDGRRLVQMQRQRADGADVRRHIIAVHAVAARRTLDERAFFVSERDRHAVDLQLGFVFDALFAEAAQDALVPLAQLVERIRVFDREHRRVMRDGGKALDEVTAHAARRRVRVVEFRMLALELREAAEELIELVVADLRPPFVVQAIVALEVAAELFDFLLRLHSSVHPSSRQRRRISGCPDGQWPIGDRVAGRPEILRRCAAKDKLLRTGQVP
ncbi:MAG TPA: hypothetical protein VHK90_01765 [Thermoanaerobaculia bacterium]|nr:hypothetical protein [Thermoanaerobaculia bacterium]